MDKDFVTTDFKSDDAENRKFVFLLFVFLITLIILIATISFAVFNKYNTGSNDNYINVGSVLFSFNEGNNYINLVDAFPMADEVGKKMNASDEYFDFDVSVGFDNSEEQNDISYEISLMPVSENTLSQNYVRVYLEENGEAISINNNDVNYFSDLENSSYNSNAKLLITRTIEANAVNHYKFRMWLSDKYKVDAKKRTFKCYVLVNAY